MAWTVLMSLCRRSNSSNLRATLISLLSLGAPLPVGLGHTANPLLINQHSKTLDTTSSIPAWTTRARTVSEPRTPMLTTHWNARENRKAAARSNEVSGFTSEDDDDSRSLGAERLITADASSEPAFALPFPLDLRLTAGFRP